MLAISVIVPVYNVEKYLPRCVESLLGQTFENFEIILVDDGSTDGSPALCDSLSAKDARIKVLHKKNGGPTSALLQGVEIAQGEYISFVDSDDWVDVNYLSVLYTGITEHRSDIAQCNYRTTDGSHIKVVRKPEAVYTEQDIKDVLVPSFSKGIPKEIFITRWTKIYRRDIVLQALKLCPPDIKHGEDHIMNFACICQSKKIVHLDTEPLYYYFDNSSSITKNYSFERRKNRKHLWQAINHIGTVYGYTDIIDVNYMTQQSYKKIIFDCCESSLPDIEKKKEIETVLLLLNDRKILVLNTEQDWLTKRICLFMIYHNYINSAILFMKSVGCLRKTINMFKEKK